MMEKKNTIEVLVNLFQVIKTLCFTILSPQLRKMA